MKYVKEVIFCFVLFICFCILSFFTGYKAAERKIENRNQQYFFELEQRNRESESLAEKYRIEFEQSTRGINSIRDIIEESKRDTASSAEGIDRIAEQLQQLETAIRKITEITTG